MIDRIRNSSLWHSLTAENNALLKTVCSVLVAIATICACILPMDKLPIWNGEVPGHRNQYELMAEAILDGRIEFDYNDDYELSQLENPYDPDARDEAGVYYHWDHAYYNGHYYMYFGVVPVFLAFLPYRIITGSPLTTYHATQIFVAVAIAGIFVLFHLLSKLFFKKLSYGVYLSLCVAFSFMSVWYASAEPALYCTAITAAIMLEIWSLYFFIRGVWGEKKENRQILFAGFGAVCGALAFGCRPPIALANVLVLPMLIVFFKEHKLTPKLFGKLALAAMPYAVVGISLMIYNYVRFDSPFEFGQAYQLTVADQSNYSLALDSETIVRIFNDTLNNFFGRKNFTASFPYLNASGVFFNFPILLMGIGMFKSSVYKSMKQNKLLPLMIGFIAAVLFINTIDILWAPYLLERYRMDIYFLMGIACYIIVGLWYDSATPKQRSFVGAATVALSAITVISAYLLCIRTMGAYYPEVITEIANILHLN